MALKAPARVFTLLLFLLVTTAYAAAQDCLNYDPAEVRLTGTIVKRTFPGAPNYESIRKGDKPETFWLLHLDNPVCVNGNTNDEFNEPERHVTDLQLVLDEKQYAQLRKLVGRRIHVVATGALFHAHTVHHRTSVLLTVKEIKRG